MADWAAVVGVLVTVIGVLALAVKLLLQDWFKKSNQLADVQKTHANDTINRLDKELVLFRQIINELKETARILSSKLDRADMRIDQLTVDLNKAIRMVDEFQSTTSEKIKNMIKTEMVEISKRAALIRAKKDGS